MKKLFIGIAVCLALFVGCYEITPTTDDIQKKRTETMMQEALREIGMPNIVNFQQLKLMKMIYELCDKENLICYAYLYNEFTGKLIFIGKCVGYGIPFSAQYTNPQKVVNDPFGNYSAGGKVIAQPDPNGLFMPTSSSATWLIMRDPYTGQIRPIYCEPRLFVSPFPMPYDLIQNADFAKKVLEEKDAIIYPHK